MSWNTALGLNGGGDSESTILDLDHSDGDEGLYDQGDGSLTSAFSPFAQSLWSPMVPEPDRKEKGKETEVDTVFPMSLFQDIGATPQPAPHHEKEKEKEEKEKERTQQQWLLQQLQETRVQLALDEMDGGLSENQRQQLHVKTLELEQQIESTLPREKCAR
jgi:hypothetical protein